MGNTWRQVEIPVAGQVVAFAHHPEDPALLFAATSDGTILKSMDGGTQWIRQNEQEGGPSLHPSAGQRQGTDLQRRSRGHREAILTDMLWP